MSENNSFKVANAVVSNLPKEDEKTLLDVYSEKFKDFKLSIRARKKVAKELNVKEKTALNWKTVSDIFSFIDSSTLAKEHPQEAARTLKIVLGVLAAIYAPLATIAKNVDEMSMKNIAKYMEWLGKPTPEHVIHKVADHFSKNAKELPIDEQDK